jgi:Fic family protein
MAGDMKRTTGQYECTSVGGEEVAAFVPHPLPPVDPELYLDEDGLDLLRKAEEGLRRLELAAEMAPSLDWFVYGFVRKEAVVSSQIEGTQASLVDLLAHEATGESDAKTSPDVREICNYLEAIRFARAEQARSDGLPLSIRLLNETHAKLMQGVRGANKLPGQVRRSQSWIGGTRPGNATFVPPPPQRVEEALSALETYMHEQDDQLPPLVRIGLLHVQFESIHPYLDGNGRVGRLLIALMLEHWSLLSSPLLYLSLFFKRHRDEYYRRLSAVRSEGDWEGWNAFFLEGVDTIAREAVDAARELFALVARDRARVLAMPHGSVMAARLFERLPDHPLLTITNAIGLLETTRPTAAKAISTLVDAGILIESSGRKRDRTFAYTGYLDLLRVGTEL